MVLLPDQLFDKVGLPRNEGLARRNQLAIVIFPSSAIIFQNLFGKRSFARLSGTKKENSTPFEKQFPYICFNFPLKQSHKYQIMQFVLILAICIIFVNLLYGEHHLSFFVHPLLVFYPLLTTSYLSTGCRSGNATMNRDPRFGPSDSAHTFPWCISTRFLPT